jgi:hypothetical protein
VALLLAATAMLMVIAVAVLFVPVGVDVTASKNADETSVAVQGHVRWMGLDIPLRRSSSPRGRPASKPRVRSSRRISALLMSPGFARRTCRLIADLAAVVRPDTFHLYARVGFDDPSETGIFLGWVSAGVMTGAIGRARIEPDFTTKVLAATLRVSWTRNLAAIVWPLFLFMASPAVWRAVRNYRASAA